MKRCMELRQIVVLVGMVAVLGGWNVRDLVAQGIDVPHAACAEVVADDFAAAFPKKHNKGGKLIAIDFLLLDEGGNAVTCLQVSAKLCTRAERHPDRFLFPASAVVHTLHTFDDVPPTFRESLDGLCTATNIDCAASSPDIPDGMLSRAVDWEPGLAVYGGMEIPASLQLFVDGKPKASVTCLVSVVDIHPLSREAVHFAFDSSVLSSEAQTILEQKAAWLAENPHITAQIEGHSAERDGGSYETDETYGLLLGDRRAFAVKQYMTTEAGRPACVAG